MIAPAVREEGEVKPPPVGFDPLEHAPENVVPLVEPLEVLAEGGMQKFYKRQRALLSSSPLRSASVGTGVDDDRVALDKWLGSAGSYQYVSFIKTNRILDPVTDMCPIDGENWEAPMRFRPALVKNDKGEVVRGKRRDQLAFESYNGDPKDVRAVPGSALMPDEWTDRPVALIDDWSEVGVARVKKLHLRKREKARKSREENGLPEVDPDQQDREVIWHTPNWKGRGWVLWFLNNPDGVGLIRDEPVPPGRTDKEAFDINMAQRLRGEEFLKENSGDLRVLGITPVLWKHWTALQELDELCQSIVFDKDTKEELLDVTTSVNRKVPVDLPIPESGTLTGSVTYLQPGGDPAEDLDTEGLQMEDLPWGSGKAKLDELARARVRSVYARSMEGIDCTELTTIHHGMGMRRKVGLVRDVQHFPKNHRFRNLPDLVVETDDMSEALMWRLHESLFLHLGDVLKELPSRHKETKASQEKSEVVHYFRSSASIMIDPHSPDALRLLKRLVAQDEKEHRQLVKLYSYVRSIHGWPLEFDLVDDNDDIIEGEATVVDEVLVENDVELTVKRVKPRPKAKSEPFWPSSVIPEYLKERYKRFETRAERVAVRVLIRNEKIRARWKDHEVRVERAAAEIVLQKAMEVRYQEALLKNKVVRSERAALHCMRNRIRNRKEDTDNRDRLKVLLKRQAVRTAEQSKMFYGLKKGVSKLWNRARLHAVLLKQIFVRGESEKVDESQLPTRSGVTERPPIPPVVTSHVEVLAKETLKRAAVRSMDWSDLCVNGTVDERRIEERIRQANNVLRISGGDYDTRLGSLIKDYNLKFCAIGKPFYTQTEDVSVIKPQHPGGNRYVMPRGGNDPQTAHARMNRRRASR